jgi:hypothetical protein
MNRAKRAPTKKAITLLDLPNYKGYTFTFFSSIAMKLCARRELEELNQQNLNSIVSEVCDCVSREIDELKKRGVDPCSIVPVPITGNDPREKMNLCYAQKVLIDFSIGVKHEPLVLPPALSLEFTEFTRGAMGTGRLKRELFVISEEVLALAIIGACLAQAYAIAGEYGYLYIDIAPHILALEKVRKAHNMAKGIVAKVQENNGSINVALIGIAAATGLALRKLVWEVAKSYGHAVVNYLRISRTGNKVMVKGFDSLDVIQLTKTVVRCGVTRALYALLSRYPPEDFTSLRRFIELIATNLIKYQSLRKPVYIYEILRYITSDELNNEGSQWYVKKSEKELGWSEIVKAMMRLSRLVE